MRWKCQLYLIGNVCSNPSDLNSTEKSKFKAEIRRYIDEGACEASPLMWWKQNQSGFPALVRMARRYLSVPATSTPSERAFSIAGGIVNKNRACLLPENVSILYFLDENLCWAVSILLLYYGFIHTSICKWVTYTTLPSFF